MRWKSSWLLVVFMTIIFWGSSFSYVYGKNNPQVILILINQLSFTDQPLYQHIVGFKELEQTAGKGAMNINSGGQRSDANSYLSIGGGSRGAGINQMEQSFHIYEKADQITTVQDQYLQRTGKKVEERQTIVCLTIEELKKKSQKYPFKVGALGETLKQFGKESRVFGNNDTNQARRLAPLITMNQAGMSVGDVSKNTLLYNPARPYGVMTDYAYLIAQWEVLQTENVSLIVFDLGDLYRLETAKEQMNEEYYMLIKKQIMFEIGRFIQQIYRDLGENQTLIVVSPMVNNQAIKEKYLLSPVWLYPLQKSGDLLISGTTKRPGIIANIDLAPTILHLLNIEEQPVEMIGQKIETMDSSISFMDELKHIAVIYQQRPTVIYIFVMWHIFVLITGMLLWLKKVKRRIWWVQSALIGLLTLPVLLLITACWTTNSAYVYISMMLVLSLFIGWFLKIFSPIPQFLIISLFTFLTITIDLILGNPFMKRSFLGYDPIIGARYYGIGNEYMGVYLGSMLLLTGAMMERWKKRFILGISALIYTGTTFILLMPTLGTNAGGAITSLIGTGFAFSLFSGYEWNKRRIGWLIFIFILGFGLLIFINFWMPTENQSHIGRILHQAYQGDWRVILQTIQRKLATNWKLMKVSSWSKIMITSIFSISIIFLKPKMVELKDKYPYLMKSFYAIIIGAVVSLIVNDSGVVAASTMIIFVAVPILYLSFIKEKN